MAVEYTKTIPWSVEELIRVGPYRLGYSRMTNGEVEVWVPGGRTVPMAELTRSFPRYRTRIVAPNRMRPLRVLS